MALLTLADRGAYQQLKEGIEIDRVWVQSVPSAFENILKISEEGPRATAMNVLNDLLRKTLERTQHTDYAKNE